MDIIGIELITNSNEKDRVMHYAEGIRSEQSESDKNKGDEEYGDI